MGGHKMSLWRAVPPVGFVALGDVLARGHHKPAADAIRCVREDLVEVLHSPTPADVMCVWTSSSLSSSTNSHPIDVKPVGLWEVRRYSDLHAPLPRLCLPACLPGPCPRPPEV